MNGIKRSGLKLFFLLLLILSITPACKDDFDSAIPYVNVNYSVNLVNYNTLNTVGFPVFFNNVGYGGIVVINNGVSFYAYDVTCPYEVDFQCRIEADGVIGTCPCCNTQYNLLDGGYVISGPSAESLKQYRASLSANRLYVTN